MVLFHSSFVILCSLTWQFITAFSIQGPLHSIKHTQQILKEALQNHEF